MPCAFTGGPYHVATFVAATHSIMIETAADALSNSGWKMVDKIGAWAEGTPTMPSNGTAIQVDGTTFHFKTTPTTSTDISIGVDLTATIANFTNAINAHSTTTTATYNVATGKIKVEYIAGGSFGNGATLSGWITWRSDSDYGAPDNQLWLGGYKFKTGFVGTTLVLGAIPSIVYILDGSFFDNGSVGGGVGFQFMSSDQAIKGAVHLMGIGPTVSMKFIGGPAQFFLLRTDLVADPMGTFVCGGSFYVNYDPLHPPLDAWYSMGDWRSNPFFYASTPRTAYGNGLLTGAGGSGFASSTECCYNRTYVGFGASNSTVTQLSLWVTPDWPFPVTQAQAHRRYGGDPIISDPFIVSGGKYRGQFFDALTVGLPFATGYTGIQLSNTYPWADGSTRPDGVPKNRLSPDFDQAVWENITDHYPYGALFVVSAIPSFMKGKFNYVYEGKA